MSALAKPIGDLLNKAALHTVDCLRKGEPVPVSYKLTDRDVLASRKTQETVQLTKLRSDLMTAQLPDPEFLWAPRIPLEGTTLLIGEDGLGKSYWALTLCLHVAAGRAFMGAPVRQGRAVYIHAEDRRPMIERRAQRILKSFTPEEAKLALEAFEHFDVAARDVKLLTCSRGGTELTGWVNSLRDQIGAARVVVLDPLARLHDGPENDNTVMTQLITASEIIASGTKGAVLLLHHPNKAGTRNHTTDGTEARGGGGLRAGARSQLRLIAADRNDLAGINNLPTGAELAGDILQLLHVKLNDGRKAARLWMLRQSDGTFTQFTATSGDPTRQLSEWFKLRDNAPASISAISRKHRGEIWQRMSERDARAFVARLVGSGELVAHGQDRGNPLYALTPATLEAIELLDAQAVKQIEDAGEFE